MRQKDIKGYEGLYQITEDGKVYSLIKGKYLKNVLADRYLIVLLYKDKKRKRYYVHRLVAEAFCSKKDDKFVVNHKDFNKENNHYSNLEWVSNKENTLHYITSDRYVKPVLTEKGKQLLKFKLNKKVKCLTTNKIYESMKQFADEKGISASNASIKLNNKYKNNLNAIFV